MNNLIEELNWLNDKQSAMLELIVRLCNQNSGTLNLEGVAQVRELLLEAFSPLGGNVSLIDTEPQQVVDDGGQLTTQQLGKIIHITKRPEAKRKVMLCIHMDTVYDLQHPFQECQTLENGNINGPGVIDAKGGLVLMLYTLLAFEQTSVAKNIGWEVVMNPDEEIGSPGSKSFIHSRAPHCDFGLLFEPSLPDGTLVSWRKGVGNFHIVVRGRSAHSGREFEKGRNAIVALARILDQVDQLNTDPVVTYNAGRVSGGGALNMVPDLAIGRINVRAKTLDQAAEVESMLAKICAKSNELDGIEVELHGGFTSPPKMPCEKTQQLQKRIEGCGAALGIPVQWKGTGGASDGNKFAAAGLPNIDTLGPQGGCIHSGDEYLMPESLVPRAKLAALILQSYAAE